MTSSTSESPKKSWPFFLLGIVCLVAFPVTLYFVFGNREVTGLPVWQSIVIGFGLSLLGYVFLVVGILRSRRTMQTIERVTDNRVTRGIVAIDKKRTWSWKIWLGMTIIDVIAMVSSWHDIYGFGLTTSGRYYAAGILLLYPLVFFIGWKLRKNSMPWYVALIDPRFVSRDEREQQILQNAALTTLGIMALVIVAMMSVLIAVPPTSALAVAWLYIAGLGMMRTIFGYIATKRGIGD